MSNSDYDSDYDSEYNSDYDSDYDNDSEDINTDIVYESEEPSKSRFCIALCELYNVKIHGQSNIQGNYLVNCRYKILHMNLISETSKIINSRYKLLYSYHHDIFPNYKDIVLQKNYIKPEIVECIYKEGLCIGIIKTFWIKIIQRTWRNVMKKREDSLKHRQTLSAIKHRELTGKWSKKCYSYGGLQGLLIKSNFL
jgi:hypothetical protein